MKDGFRVSFIGFITAIAFGLLLMLSAKWYGKNYLGKNFDAYFLSLLGIIGAGLGWIIRWIVASLSKKIDSMEESIKKKADITYVDEKIKDEKENTKQHIDAIHEFMASIDHKIDILLKR